MQFVPWSGLTSGPPGRFNRSLVTVTRTVRLSAGNASHRSHEQDAGDQADDGADGTIEERLGLKAFASVPFVF